MAKANGDSRSYRMKVPLISLLLALLVPASIAADQDVRADFKRSTSLQATVRRLSQRVSALETSLQQSSATVAFHAKFSRDPVTLGPSQRLILDSVDTNVGNGYDATSGEFRAPVSGTYMFVVNFMGPRDDFQYVNMIRDGSTVAYSISHGDGSTWDHVSETAILHLTAGERVWLIRGSEQHRLKSLRGSLWTTFSGFLIGADQGCSTCTPN